MTTRSASVRMSDSHSRLDSHPDFKPQAESIVHEFKYAWKPGVWAQLPWQGLGSLVLVVLLTGASVGIVALSHNSSIDKWRVGSIGVQPQVWLAVFSTIVNALLGFALTQGVYTHFWKQAGRGTTLRELHNIYESTALLGAAKTLLQGSWNVVVIACIIVTVCMARDPFFQRASVVENVQRVVMDAVDIRSALFVPFGFFKLTPRNPQLSLDSKQAFLNMFVDAIPYDVGNIPCADGCKSFLKGFGFEPVCESQSYEYDISKTLAASRIPSPECRSYWHFDDVYDVTKQNFTLCHVIEDSFLEPKMTAFDVEYDVFDSHHVGIGRSIDFEGGYVILAGSPKEMRITTKFKDMPTCKGFAQMRTCTLHQAVVEYAVILQNNTISLQHPHWQNDTILYRHAIDKENYAAHWLKVFSILNPAHKRDLRHTIGKGIQGDDYVNCDTHLGSVSSNMSCLFSSSLSDSDFTFRNATRFENTRYQNHCDGTWRDPTQDILDDIRNFAFRVSLIAAPLTDMTTNKSDWVAQTSNWTQRVEFNDGVKLQTVYKAKWSFVAAAVILSLAGVLSVASLFWGWWELGRPVSLNPLEVGMAFDSPIFSAVNSNSCRSQIVRTIGTREVKYGGRIREKFERAPVNESVMANESRLMSEGTLVSGNASADESALTDESASVNEGASMSENEPIAFSKKLPRLRMELNEDHLSDDEDWVTTPKPGDSFS